jgi:L-gulonolactone oxidase
MWGVRYFGATTEDSEFAIRVSQLDEWVKDVRAIIEGETEDRQKHLDRRYGKGKVKSCITPGYFWLRFGQPNDNLLSISTGMQNQGKKRL